MSSLNVKIILAINCVIMQHLYAGQIMYYAVGKINKAAGAKRDT
jgi:hypothetical protein